MLYLKKEDTSINMLSTYCKQQFFWTNDHLWMRAHISLEICFGRRPELFQTGRIITKQKASARIFFVFFERDFIFFMTPSTFLDFERCFVIITRALYSRLHQNPKVEHETHIPAQETKTKIEARIPETNEYSRRTRCA
ncbi:MAG: hypothetical protein A3J52_01015 [Omnitrophica bacterium RIFCSPHIGHO2_02_FULL_49_9]|nr:MAG: hypothetical protein A3J52_01015 [Omnitrophica bacterium RIFCSPHIGHO2_02_FULL_49_9]OGW93852.1 MAG: hypothetical protein A3K16_04170 [Omnitrophica bacterium RIFCSPLOWO2_01_FULL_45_24]